MGYEVADLGATLEKAKAAGATVLVGPFLTDDRRTAMVLVSGRVYRGGACGGEVRGIAYRARIFSAARGAK